MKELQAELPRRQFLRLAACGAILPSGSRLAWAQGYPTRPVRCIVGYAAGGGTDVFARLVGQSMSERLGQPFVIENRPGASGNIATEVVVRAPPDGYTILGVDAAAAINATLYDDLSFNFIRDITVVGIIRGPLVMVVHPSVPAETVLDFIAYVRANPGKTTMASAGTGNSSHLAGELFKAMTETNMTQVPYRGAAPATTDLLGGQVQVFFSGAPAVIEHVRAGRLRALAVTTAVRLEALPEVPMVGDFVPGYEASQWYALGLRRNTNPGIVDKLSTEVNRSLADPKMKARLADLGTTVFPGSPADFGKFVSDETEKWGKVVKLAGVRLD